MATASSHHTAHVTARAIIQENVEFTAERAAQVVNLINRLQTREVQRAAAAGRTVSATQLLTATEDAIDTFTSMETPQPNQPQDEGGATGHTAYMALRDASDMNGFADSNYFAALAPCTDSEVWMKMIRMMSHRMI